jgi:hypothetical protein
VKKRANVSGAPMIRRRHEFRYGFPLSAIPRKKRIKYIAVGDSLLS